MKIGDDRKSVSNRRNLPSSAYGGNRGGHR